MITVVLDDFELEWAQEMAAGRQRNAEARHARHRYNFDGDAQVAANINVLGCVGEMAVAKGLDYRHGLPQDIWGGKDYGPYQVRTRTRMDHNLLLHRADRDDDIVIAVVCGVGGQLCAATLVGWCYQREGKLEEFWEDKGNGRPCFFVPNRALHDMDTLPLFEYDPDGYGDGNYVPVYYAER